ncbi:MAG: decaprenyl-phosphate phosphoribosyltransferase [Burkholderiales bacterium]
MRALADFIALARPAHWIKNGFVLMGLLFGHGWNNPPLLRDVWFCFAAFCLVSSAVYAFNDFMDREADRAHPKKRERPVASGAISGSAALIFAICLALGGLALAATASTIAVGLVLAYIALNLGYSLGLKHVVVLDVFLISAGFMLRILVGTLGIGIEPSNWLIFCGFTLTLFLGFVKRRSELAGLQLPLAEDSPPGARVPTRKVLSLYRLHWLDKMIAVCAGCAVLAYGLYTIDARTIALHGTTELWLTVPLVAYGIGRYLWTLYRHGRGADPAAQLWRDPHLLGTLLGWLALTAWLIA